jgi:hypothetical protein
MSRKNDKKVKKMLSALFDNINGPSDAAFPVQDFPAFFCRGSFQKAALAMFLNFTCTMIFHKFYPIQLTSRNISCL